ncbi:hypothetical protein PtA15_1A626 [Puccinia triticina]|uniref:AGC-kinase C-terminal domain-containing protein n=1 Tax=Puccinia triticina TaxID=208348 RepID=A0ABY7C7Z3_9BASI|nr:uncharacterized protein PtA15_1A626 [Puccinia triticina]WAQ81286.1 hypothetical protein PtA15_1A626 [Puccinia triticina]
MVEKNVTRAVAAKRVERVDAVARREEAVVAELLTSGIPITNDASQRAVDHNLEDEFMTPEGSDEPTKSEDDFSFRNRSGGGFRFRYDYVNP